MTIKSTPSQIKSGGHRLFVKEVTDDGMFEGYGSVFDVEDSYGEVVEAGAFDESLKEHTKNGTLPAMLWQHDPSKPIGVYKEMREDAKGLFVRGQLELETQLGKEAHALLKAGALNGLSIGYMCSKWAFDDETNIRTLQVIDLWEVSLVTFPANSASRVEGVKTLDAISGLASLKDVERYLRDEGNYSARAATAMVSRIKQLTLDERDARKAKADMLTSSKRLEDLLKT